MTIATESDLPAQQTVVPETEMTADQFEVWAFAQELIRCEWVEGKIVLMAPVTDWHNNLNVWLITLLSFFVEERDLGIVRFNMLFRMPGRRRIPDLFIIKRENLARLKPTALDGPADLAIEIVSQDSGSRDWREKYLEYEAGGVGEYWVIDPASQVVECYALGADRRFHPNTAKDDKIASAVLPDFYLRPSWLWQNPLPRMAGILREMGVTL